MKDNVPQNQSTLKGAFHRLSIQTKLVVIILAAAVILISIGFSAIIYWEVKTLNRHALEETEFAVTLMSQDLSRLLLVNSIDAAADTVASLKLFDRINAAVIYDLQNQPVFYYLREPRANFDPLTLRAELMGKGSGFNLTLPVLYHDVQYGKIDLNVSSGVYRARLMGYIKVITLILPLLIMLSVFIAIKFQKFFSGPILRLVKVIKRVSSTQDYSQKLIFDETNEIGELYRGFNLLMAQVDFNTQRLQAVRDELENSNVELNKLNSVLQDHKFAIDQAAKVSITDAVGNITYVNDQFCAMSKYSKQELIGKTYKVVKSGFHTREFFADLWNTVKRGQVWKGEVQNRAKDGSYYWVNTTIVPFLDDEGNPSQYFAIHFDITSRKEAERSLRTARDVAESAVASQSGFIKTLSDEVRYSIQVFLANDALGCEARREIEGLLTLFNNAIDYSRVLSNQLILQRVEFDLRRLIHSIDLAEFSPGVPEITWFAFTRAQVPVTLIGDPGRVREIIRSFIGVVLHYARYGSLSLEVIPLEFEPGKVTLRFNLNAKSLALSGELVNKIRGIFASLKTEPPQELVGWRISSALSMQLIKQMEGEMAVEILPEQGGTLFWFTLKLDLPLPALRDVDDAVALEPLASLPYRLLYAGNDSALFDFLCDEASREYGRASRCDSLVQIEDSLIEGIDRNLPYSVVMFDFANESSLVLEFVRRLRANPLYRAIRWIKVDTIAHRGDAQQAEQAGFNGYLARPLPKAEIGVFVRCFLETPPAFESPIRTRFHCQGHLSSPLQRALVIHHAAPERWKVAQELQQRQMVVDVATGSHETALLQGSSRYCIVLLEVTKIGAELRQEIDALRSRFAAGQPMPIIGLISESMHDASSPTVLNGLGLEEVIVWPPSKEAQILSLVDKWTIDG